MEGTALSVLRCNAPRGDNPHGDIVLPEKVPVQPHIAEHCPLFRAQGATLTNRRVAGGYLLYANLFPYSFLQTSSHCARISAERAPFSKYERLLVR